MVRLCPFPVPAQVRTARLPGCPKFSGLFTVLWCIVRRLVSKRDKKKTRLIMPSTTDLSPVMEKTRELCETILQQPSMQALRQRVDAFMGDQTARSQYEHVVNQGQALQQKQEMAQPLSGEEISDFEQRRDALLRNPVARGFLDAQEEIHQVQQTVQRYVSKTLELGRLPTEDELDGGSCGSGCGCHGH